MSLINKCKGLLAALLCVILCLSGCYQETFIPPVLENSSKEESSSLSEEESSAVESGDKPAWGGTLRMTAYMPETLNPLEARQNEVAQLLMLIFMPLLETDAQGVPSSEGVVKEWQVSLDGYEVTLRIHENIYWHDGEKLTAKDVVYSLNALAQAETDHFWKNQLKTMVSAVLNEAGEVVVTFSNPVDEQRMSALVVPVLPEHIYNVEEPPKWVPVGSGPYKYVDYQAMRQLQLESNVRYIGGKPYISELIVDITRSSDATHSAFVHGLSHILYEEVPSGMSTENIYHHVVYQTDTHNLQVLYMNQEEEHLLSDVNMRRAIMYCVDPQELIDWTQVHQGTPSESVVPSWLAEDALESTYGVDYAKAYSLLGDNKMAELTLIVSEEEEVAIAQGRLIYEQLAEIGLRVKVVQLEHEEWLEALEDGEYDLAFGSCRVSSAQDLYTLLGSEGSGNYTGRTDDELDRLLSEVAAATGTQQSVLAYEALAQYAWETLPVAPLYYSKQAVVVSKELGGELSPSPYHIYKGIEDLYFK
ncbi:MAG: ABC transporter substrate-binding protein [Firmicutes bacterium]|nr:ABC transporter substrate-binding protein [Bacillota bacterium]